MNSRLSFQLSHLDARMHILGWISLVILSALSGPKETLI